MTVLVGPCFSLAASGLVGKALLYYDTKYGARVRKPRSRFTPPGTAWEINKVWFKKASDRAKTLTREQKWAFRVAYPEICDSWRDIFMGKQIEFWNLSPLNDLTWPHVVAQRIGDIVFGSYEVTPLERRCWFEKYEIRKVETQTCGTLWWIKFNDASAPSPSDPYTFRRSYSNQFDLVNGRVNYLWGGVRYIDGTYKAQFIEAINLT